MQGRGEDHLGYQTVKAVLQIAEKSRLLCEGKVISDCGAGMCVLLGLHRDDGEREADCLIDRILKLRVFRDGAGKLNLSAVQAGADLLVVSNFTLCANLKSRRPDFDAAMKYDAAKTLYDTFLKKMQEKADELCRETGKSVRVFPGVFGGDMKVEITGDGPVTIVMDTREFL